MLKLPLTTTNKFCRSIVHCSFFTISKNICFLPISWVVAIH